MAGGTDASVGDIRLIVGYITLVEVTYLGRTGRHHSEVTNLT